jgi:hypothetical protein
MRASPVMRSLAGALPTSFQASKTPKNSENETFRNQAPGIEIIMNAESLISRDRLFSMT